MSAVASSAPSVSARSVASTVISSSPGGGVGRRSCWRVRAEAAADTEDTSTFATWSIRWLLSMCADAMTLEMTMPVTYATKQQRRLSRVRRRIR